MGWGIRIVISTTFLTWGLTACVSPSTQDMPASTTPYDAAAEYSAEHSGYAVLVYKSNQLIYEAYQGGSTSTDPHPIFSGTKSFSCALAAAAIQDGLISSVDEPVVDQITEWAGDTARSAITIRHLLTLSSGLQESFEQLTTILGNAATSAIASPIVSPAGTTFSYGETDITIFSEFIRRKLKTTTGEDTLAYLKRRILDPIGLTYSTWVRDGDSNPMMSFGAVLTARDWAKYGLFILNGGSVNGTQIVAQSDLAHCTNPSSTMPGYGWVFWLNSPIPAANFQGIVMLPGTRPTFAMGGPNGLLSQTAPQDLFAAAGLADNRMYILPSQNLVVVRMANGGLGSDFEDAAFLSALPLN